MAIADSVPIGTSVRFQTAIRLDNLLLEDWMRRHLFGAALAVLLGGISAYAQQTSGNITGRVLDPQGAPFRA